MSFHQSTLISPVDCPSGLSLIILSLLLFLGLVLPDCTPSPEPEIITLDDEAAHLAAGRPARPSPSGWLRGWR